ncbi:MAG: radical SAM protein [Deltaproteobacteria bacterium]
METTPTPTRIGIELKVTNRCNLHCSYCMNSDSPCKSGEVDTPLFLKRLQEMHCNGDRPGFAIKEVRMTGGEPLLAVDAVAQIANICRTLGIASGINTNGIFLTASVAAKLKEAGLNTVKVSLDAAEDFTLWKMRSKPASIKKITQGILNAVQNDFKVIVRFTLCRYNRDHLIPCYEMVRDMAVTQFQIKPLVPAGRALESDLFLSLGEVVEALTELAQRVSGPFAKPQVLCWNPEKAGGLSARSCGSLDKIYISTELDVMICNYHAEPIPFGNLNADSLERVLLQRPADTVEIAAGHAIVAGCPQIEVLERFSSLTSP